MSEASLRELQARKTDAKRKQEAVADERPDLKDFVEARVGGSSR